MATKRTILIQLDTDPQPSVFDRVVAVDAGVDELFAYSGVTESNVEPLVHGAMFTRGGSDLKHTALFIGGSNVRASEAILRRIEKTFFGPVRVSVMLDPNGANTTAAAAVLAAGQHLDFKATTALVLGGTGPVGQRAARLLARQGATVRLASRSGDRATEAAVAVNEAVAGQRVTGVEASNPTTAAKALDGAHLVVAAGAAGSRLRSSEVIAKAGGVLKVAIDLNAVPPSGIEPIEAADKAKEHDGLICYGAIGVGGLKMKIHKAAIAALFEANDRVLDAETIYAIGQRL